MRCHFVFKSDGVVEWEDVRQSGLLKDLYNIERVIWEYFRRMEGEQWLMNKRILLNFNLLCWKIPLKGINLSKIISAVFTNNSSIAGRTALLSVFLLGGVAVCNWLLPLINYEKFEFIEGTN